MRRTKFDLVDLAFAEGLACCPCCLEQRAGGRRTVHGGKLSLSRKQTNKSIGLQLLSSCKWTGAARGGAPRRASRPLKKRKPTRLTQLHGPLMETSAAAAPRSEDGVAEPLRIGEAAGMRFRVLSSATLRDGCEKRPPPPSREQPLHSLVLPPVSACVVAPPRFSALCVVCLPLFPSWA